MNNYYILQPTSNDIYHHGVLGQSWGDRNGPPYPLDSGSHSAREKKAGWKKSLNNGVTRQTVKTRKATSESRNKSGTDVQVSTYRTHANTGKDKGLALKTGTYATLNNMHTVNRISQDNVNCALCTYAMDLRQRGYDVGANTKQQWSNANPGTHTSTQTIQSLYKTKDGKTPQAVSLHSGDAFRIYDGFDAKTIRTGVDMLKRNKAIKEEIVSNGGNGSYGHLMMQNMITDENHEGFGKSLGGHDVFYKIENGEVIIYDGQIDKRMPYDEYMTMNSKNGITMYPEEYLRTDNLELSNGPKSKEMTIEENSARYHYSPNEKSITKIKATVQYSPPYVSETKEIIQYTPPYNTKQSLISRTNDAIKNVSKTTKLTVTDKIKNTVDSIIDKFSNLSITNSNQTSSSSMLKFLKRG